MWNLIKKDYFLIFANKKNVLTFILLVPILILILNKYIQINSVILGLISSLIINIFIDSDSQILLYSLPVKNSQFVLSKYIFIAINFIIMNIYIIFIMELFSSLVLKRSIFPINNYYILISIQISLIALCFAIPAIINYSAKPSIIIIWIINVVAFNFSTSVITGDYQFFSKIIYSMWFNIGIVIILITSILCTIESYKNRQFY